MLYIGTFLVGAMKCGTTTLADLLFQHPQITPVWKDPHAQAELASRAAPPRAAPSVNAMKGPRVMLTRTKGIAVDWDRGVATSPHAGRWKEKRFNKRLAACLPETPRTRPDGRPSYAADCSPVYFDSVGTAEAIKSVYPDARILVTLRNPADWLYSHHYFLFFKGRHRQPLFAPECFGKKNAEKLERSLANHFSRHLRHWLEVFGHERVKTVILEEWRRRQRRTAQECYRFIGVDDAFEATPKRHNHNKRRRYPVSWLARQHYRLACYREPRRGRKINKRLNAGNRLWQKGYPPMPDDIRRRLDEYFKPQVDAVEAILGRDIPAWRRNP